MPVLRIMQLDEIVKLVGSNDKTNVRVQIQQEYDQLIAEVIAGQFASVTLSDDENKATVRNRLKGAADRRGLNIMFRRTRDNTIIFQLEEPAET